MNMEFFTLFLVCRKEYVNLPWSSVVLKTDICPSATAGQGPCKQPSELMIRQRIKRDNWKKFLPDSQQNHLNIELRNTSSCFFFFKSYDVL